MNIPVENLSAMHVGLYYRLRTSVDQGKAGTKIVDSGLWQIRAIKQHDTVTTIQTQFSEVHLPQGTIVSIEGPPFPQRDR